MHDVQDKHSKDGFCSNCSHTFDKNGMCPCKFERINRINKDEEARIIRHRKWAKEHPIKHNKLVERYSY